MRVITVANSKGGSGKSTTTFNLGAALSKKGHKVLLWDLDPQVTLTNIFKFEFPETQVYSEDIVSTDRINPCDGVVEVGPNLFLIPATKSLGSCEDMLKHDKNRFRVRNAVARLSQMDFDIVLLDPPGNTDMFMCSVLLAAKEILIPVRPSDTDMQTMLEFKDDIEAMKAENPELKVKGILFNQNVGNSKSEKIYRNYLSEAKWDSIVCENSIKMGAAINKAAAQGMDVITYDPKSIPAIAYMKLAEEVTSWKK